MLPQEYQVSPYICCKIKAHLNYHVNHLSNSFISGAGNMHQQSADNGMHMAQSLPSDGGVMGQSRLVEVGCNGSYNQQSPWQTIPTSGNGVSLAPGYIGVFKVRASVPYSRMMFPFQSDRWSAGFSSRMGS